MEWNVIKAGMTGRLEQLRDYEAQGNTDDSNATLFPCLRLGLPAEHAGLNIHRTGSMRSGAALPLHHTETANRLMQSLEVAKEILENNKPLFGICLGHQVIGLANGVSTYKMFNGHRGINHPVKNLISGKGEITSQNHGFAVNKEELENNPDLEITHVHLNDGTVAGMRMKNKNCFSVQYHPEASPGPHDSSYLFDQFIENIKG